MTDDLHTYDPAASLTIAKAIADCLADVEQTGDLAYIAQAQAVAERAQKRLKKRLHDEDSLNFRRNDVRHVRAFVLHLTV